MNKDKCLGKITKVSFGYGGYQDACFGLSLEFQFDGCCGVSTFIGNWDAEIMECSKNAKWTEADRSKWHDDLVRKLSKLLKQAKKRDIYELKGVPVELTFENLTLKDWRILEEVL